MLYMVAKAPPPMANVSKPTQASVFIPDVTIIIACICMWWYLTMSLTTITPSPSVHQLCLSCVYFNNNLHMYLHHFIFLKLFTKTCVDTWALGNANWTRYVYLHTNVDSNIIVLCVHTHAREWHDVIKYVMHNSHPARIKCELGEARAR